MNQHRTNSELKKTLCLFNKFKNKNNNKNYKLSKKKLKRNLNCKK